MPRKTKQQDVEPEPNHSTGTEGYLYKDGEQQDGQTIVPPTAVDAAVIEPTPEDRPEEQEEKKPRISGLIFVGDGEPKRSVRIGMLKIELPDAAPQRKGFVTDHAKLIRTNLKGYKPFNPLAKE